MQEYSRRAGASQRGRYFVGNISRLADPGQNDPTGALENGFDSLIERVVYTLNQTGNSLGFDS